MNYIVYQIILASVATSIFCDGGIRKRVIGGEVAPIDKYHWAVSLKGSVDKFKASGACGASILKSDGGTRWLITAAHCFFPAIGISLLEPKHWHVRVGLRNVDFKYEKHKLDKLIKDKLKSFFNKAYKTFFGKDKFSVSLKDLHIKEIFVHPDYKHPRLENDIALMKLVDPLPLHELKNVDAIELPDDSLNKNWPKEEAQCLVVGWGCTKSGGQPSPVAKLALLNIWNNSKCESSFGAPIDLNPETEFCAGYINKNYGLCPGDSGSGLACLHNDKWKIAGIVSAAHSRTPGEFPALFTRVSSFKPWILETIKAN